VKSCFRKEVKGWLGDQLTPDMMLRKLEEEMKNVNGDTQHQDAIRRETELNKEHSRILMMQKGFGIRGLD
jgi:hypothetical protein